MANDHSIPWSQIILKAFLGLVMACALGLTATVPAFAQEIVAIAAGGPAQSNSSGGDYSFVADEDFSGGGDNSPVTATINLTQPGANAAPMGVYQHGRAGAFTYTIPGLTAGSTYTVLLHFAETYFTAAGEREFDVAINGTSVLTNLDIYATVGKDAALLETFTATANSSGQIVIAFTLGAANQPVVMGIEIRSTSSCTTVPSAPAGLAAKPARTSAGSPVAASAAAKTARRVRAFVVGRCMCSTFLSSENSATARQRLPRLNLKSAPPRRNGVCKLTERRSRRPWVRPGSYVNRRPR